MAEFQAVMKLLGPRWTYIVTDQSGKYLLTAYYGAGKAAIYPITKDGTVGERVPPATKKSEVVRRPLSFVCCVKGSGTLILVRTGN